jgi:uncharacterized membrane protein
MLIAARPGKGSAARSIATVAGLALIGFAAYTPIVASLQQAGARRRSGQLRFSFVVERPVEEVFTFCANFENFPRFLTALREVRDNGDGRSHWCANTPGRGMVEFDAVTTKFVTNSVIGWRTVRNAPVQMNGVLRFTNEDGRTCVQVSIDYAVNNGSLASALAALAMPSAVNRIEREFRAMERSVTPAE